MRNAIDLPKSEGKRLFTLLSRKQMLCRNIYSINPLPTVWHNDMSEVEGLAVSVGSEFCIVDRFAHRLLTDGLEMSGLTFRNDIVKWRGVVMN